MNLINKIDNYLLNKERRIRSSHYPSDANSCIRQLYYKWTGVEESNPNTAGNIWKMEIGNSIHDLTTDFLKNAGLITMPEIAFKKEIPGLKNKVSGRIDNVFVDDDGMAAGLEVKTSFGQGIKYIQKTGKPKEDHLVQVAMYLHFTNIKRFYLLYIGRDNAYRTQFMYTKEDLDINMDEIINKYKDLEIALEAKKLPDRQYNVVIKEGEIKDKVQKKGVITKSDWKCIYCNHKNLCWKEKLELDKS